MKIRVKLDEGAMKPERAHDRDAGFDLFTKDEVYIFPRSSVAIDTGVHVEIPRGYVGFLKSKSGLNLKHELHAEGVIDSGYTGSIVVKMYNDSGETFKFKAGQKCIQIVFLPLPEVELEFTDSLEETERGNGGFGSTGDFGKEKECR